jgi:non-specific serine/threonine protein kinase/serine/threonine-protein kinase
VREIGHGGMGTVFLAIRADEQFKKRVAIKVVRRGMDTEAVLRRFRQERQILAGLEHPNIARLLDGGNTEDSLPYLVMEYVEGEPVTTWCESRGLGVRERIALFRTICAAVHFAHQNLVVHRDLKPGNILVAANGAPKLLDFGVAKLLNPEVSGQTLDLTGASVRVFTPEYASPEQIRGERITTATDVYALGVLLHEILTGRRPGAEPGRKKEALPADLDMIVGMAMRPEPARRYASAEQLSEDLRRYLEGLPVKARRDTFSYRTGRFLTRHKASAVAAALVTVSLVGGILATARQTRIARAERARADRRLEDVRRLAGSFLFEFHDAIATLPGSTPARELVVRRALEYLGTLAKETSGDPVAERDLADAYERLGEVEGGGSGPNLGDTKGAITSERTALAIREALVARPGAGAPERESLAASHGILSKLLLKSWELEPAREEGRKAVALLEEIARTDSSPRVLLRLGGTYHNLGLLEDLLGRRDVALATLGKSTAAFAAAAATKPGNVDARRGLALATFERASVYYHSGDLPAARAEGEKAVAIYESLLANDPENSRFKMDLAMALHDLGSFSPELKSVPQAIVHQRRALALVEELAAADPRDARARVAVAYCANGLGESLAMNGDVAAALALHTRAARLSEAVLASDPANGYARRNLALASELAGDTLSLRPGRPRSSSAIAEARGWYTRALGVWQAMGRDHKLQGEDAEAPERILKAIARCEDPASLRNPKQAPTQ